VIITAEIPEEPARVPVGELRELAEEWRKKPGLYNPKYITDQMQNEVQNNCADELQEVIESYTDND
jgi:hypothetical protein